MTESVNELKKMLEESDEEKKVISPQKWSGFVESTVVNFFDQYKIDLEIDGKQHSYEDRIIHDKERDEFLTKNGSHESAMGAQNRNVLQKRR